MANQVLIEAQKIRYDVSQDENYLQLSEESYWAQSASDFYEWERLTLAMDERRFDFIQEKIELLPEDMQKEVSQMIEDIDSRHLEVY